MTTDQPAHVLVVDDDGDVRDVIAELLVAGGYRTTIAGGGAEMRALLAGTDRVDVVVLDAHMPGEPSVTLAQHVLAQGIRLVMVSGNPDQMMVHRERDLQLLHKPFNRDELYRAIRHALASETFGQRKEDPD